MTTNAENLAKAWILGLDPSILLRISNEKWFSRCFLPLKLLLSCPSLVPTQNGCCSHFISMVLCSSRSGPRIFTTLAKRDFQCSEQAQTALVSIWSWGSLLQRTFLPLQQGWFLLQRDWTSLQRTLLALTHLSASKLGFFSSFCAFLYLL